jgi:diguanylate cyclase (GGDEF)-like protein
VRSIPEVMSRPRSSRLDARRAALLFCVAGALAIVNAWLPGVCPPALRPAFTGLGVLDLAIAGALTILPWERWSRRALLVIPVLALLVVDLFAIIGRLEPWIYSVFILATAVWVGLALPRWSTAWLTPVVASAYVVPLFVADRAHDAASTVGLVVPVVVVLGEVIAQAVAGLHATSRRDDLTGVGNRRHGMEVLERLRPGDAVFVLDLDRFKDVNDREGHAGGDAVLAELGAMLRQTMRGADAVARLGGEEFLVVATQAGTAAAALAERLVRDWRETAPRTTISVGATVHRRGDAPSQALERADKALYRAKRAGRDRSCYSPPTA